MVEVPLLFLENKFPSSLHQVGGAQGVDDMKMRFSCEDLVAKLRENLEEHRRILKEATEGYEEEARVVLKKMVAHFEETGELLMKDLHALEKPQDYSREYAQVIDMLEKTTDETIELTQQAYACYVLDEWNWQEGFLRSTSTYSGTARAKLRF